MEPIKIGGRIKGWRKAGIFWCTAAHSLRSIFVTRKVWDLGWGGDNKRLDKGGFRHLKIWSAKLNSRKAT